MLLMDVGAEYANYSSDMTRTVPVNGRFSDRQRAVYNAVKQCKRGSYKNVNSWNNLGRIS